MNDLQKKSELVIQTLVENKDNIERVIPFDFADNKVTVLNLTENNIELQNLDLSSTEKMNEYIFGLLEKNGTCLGVGGYQEDRIIYRRSEHFNLGKEETRSVHLGIDIWVGAGTLVHAPLDAKVHSFQDNNNFGDYGPTIILEHDFHGVIFYILYGHLSRESFVGLYEGKEFKKADVVASIGNFPINGDWPPHLHFQLIVDIGNKKGDFPGVSSPSQKEYYQMLCPNPNLVLQAPQL